MPNRDPLRVHPLLDERTTSQHREPIVALARLAELHKLARILDHLLETSPGWDLLAEFEAGIVERPYDFQERAARNPELACYVDEFADRVYQAITGLHALGAASRAGVRMGLLRDGASRRQAQQGAAPRAVTSSRSRAAVREGDDADEVHTATEPVHRSHDPIRP